MYENKIRHLKEMLRVLDEKILNHKTENTQIIQWAQQRLQINEEIRRLERLQWEHDHESVDFNDH